MSDQKDTTVGVNEIADKLQCSPRTIRRWHVEGKIKSFKIGGKTSPIRMHFSDLKRLVKKGGVRDGGGAN